MSKCRRVCGPRCPQGDDRGGGGPSVRDRVRILAYLTVVLATFEGRVRAATLSLPGLLPGLFTSPP